MSVLSEIKTALDHLPTVSSAVSFIEQASADAKASGSTVTSEQKQQAAITLLRSVLGDRIEPILSLVTSLIGAVVTIYNAWGIFKK